MKNNLRNEKNELMNHKTKYKIHPKWFSLTKHLFKLYINPNKNNLSLIERSYDKISSVYERSGTLNYWKLSDDMLDRLSPEKNMKALDLFCGTGYITDRISKITKNQVIGIDISKEMLTIAKRKRGQNCKYVNSEVLNFLKKQSKNSYDIVTCGWGLGYSKPFQVLKEINRILKNNGKIGIVENTAFTTYEITLAEILAIAEKPEILNNYLQFRFPISIYGLIIKMRFSGFHIYDYWKGNIIYYRCSGEELVKELRNSSTFAGLEYAINKKFREDYFKRIAYIIDSKYRKKKQIPIHHRYIGAIGIK